MTLSANLNGRVAVITGASSGIGEATARQLASRGASVALIARRADKLEALAAEITAAGGTALVIVADVTDADAITRAAATVQEKLGTTSILFNNAGIMLPAPMQEHNVDQWKHQIDLNVTALVTTIGAFVDQLVVSASQGGPADLINTSSIAGQNIFPNFSVYSATKAFVTHLTTTLRVELGAQGVRVGSIAPGLVKTELAGHVTDAGVSDWIAGADDSITLLNAEDIAEIITFTVSLPAHVNLQQVVVLPTGQPS